MKRLTSFVVAALAAFAFSSSTVTVNAQTGVADAFTMCPVNGVPRTAPQGAVAAVVTWNHPMINDPSGLGTVTRTRSPGETFSSGDTLVVYTFTHPTKPTVTCSFTVTVIQAISTMDIMVPVISNCPADIRTNRDQGQTYATVTWEEPIVYDDSGVPPNRIQTNVPGERFESGQVNVVTYTFRDGAFNLAQCQFAITVSVDNVNPVITCPTNIVRQVTTGNANGLSITWGDATATDNSGGQINVELLPTSQLASGSFATFGIYTIEYRATDQAGNTASCSFTVTVADLVRPVVICPDNIIGTIDFGLGGINVVWTAPTVTDNSGSSTQVLQTHTSGQFFQTGMTTVTYLYRDDASNSNQCSFTVTITEEINECIISPCMNNGSCVDKVNGYFCECPEGFVGTACEFDILDHCASQPCVNGGTCINRGAEGFVCNCSQGYMGFNCEMNINVCDSSPCMNNGICIDDVIGFFCRCLDRFVGTLCEIDYLDRCANQPCANGGTCMDMGEGFMCSCVQGYTGSNCDMNINECASSPCLNNGACIDDVNMYVCQCLDRFAGTHCQIDILDHCVNQPCVNGGTCIGMGTQGYMCNCVQGYTGSNCEINVNECESSPCEYNGSCIDGVDRFICNCVVGVVGTLCEININECTSNPCQNGICIDGINRFSCTCQPGWTGDTCETDACKCFENQTNYEIENCVISESCNVDLLLLRISQIPVDTENVEDVAEVLANTTSFYTEITGNGISNVAVILENIANVSSPSIELVKNVIEAVDNILNVPDDLFSTNMSSARILQAFEMQLTFPRDNVTSIRNNIAVQVVVPTPSFDYESLGYASVPIDDKVDNSLISNNGVVLTSKEASLELRGKAEALVVLPSEIFDAGVSNGFSNSSTGLAVNFVVYQNSKLFQLPKDKAGQLINDQIAVNSRVISASVASMEVFTNLMDPIIASFLPLNDTSKGDTTCVFWDPKLAAGASTGNWSTEGCGLSVAMSGQERAVVCQCSHLTNFAILISYYGDIMDPVLDYISKIGCGISIAALVLTISITVITKELGSTPRKSLLNLCLALLLLYCMFLVGIEMTRSRLACTIFAALIQYFFLASVCWSSAEALTCFYLLVLSRRHLVPRYFWAVLAFAWGVPALFVFCTFALSYFVNGTWELADQYCFLPPGQSLYFGVLLPVGALLLFNTLIFMLLVRRLLYQRVQTSTSRQQTRIEAVLSQARIMFPISLLLGGTWLFGFLGIGVLTTPFHYIFAILNSLIGLGIFIFFVLLRKKGRQSLKQLLCCVYCRGERPHSLTQSSSDNRAGRPTLSTGI